MPESHVAFWSQPLRHNSPLAGRNYQQRWPGSYSGANAMIAGALNCQEAYAAGLGPEQGGINITHLVGMHNDVQPQPGWMDMLVEEMLRTGADFLSVVLPIKDHCGLSSCAIDSDNPYQVTRRITMAEVYDLPETFTSEDCGYPPGTLLVNTGCWIMDFSKPWRLIESAPEVLAMTIDFRDRIGRRPEKPDGSKPGYWESQHAPSDWGLSRYLNGLGLKVAATRKIIARHWGLIPFTNDSPWGEWKIDDALKHKFDSVPIRNEAYCQERDRKAREKEIADARSKEAGDAAQAA
ncbi:MAG: hypothetical protein KGL39_25740 [Patescibacteria group bacterium]|nr:hypothetical protein [Patescibacteria group bacterium]